MIWNRKVFRKVDQWVGEFSVSVVLKEVNGKAKWTVTSVYGLTDSRIRHVFWEELDSIQRRWSGPWCLGGDRNVIRFPSERSSGNLNPAELSFFQTGLINIPWLTFIWGERSTPGRITKSPPFYLASTDFWCVQSG